MHHRYVNIHLFYYSFFYILEDATIQLMPLTASNDANSITAINKLMQIFPDCFYKYSEVLTSFSICPSICLPSKLVSFYRLLPSDLTALSSFSPSFSCTSDDKGESCRQVWFSASILCVLLSAHPFLHNLLILQLHLLHHSLIHRVYL